MPRSNLEVLPGFVDRLVERLVVRSLADLMLRSELDLQEVEELGLTGQLSFSLTSADGSVVELRPDGASIIVTDENKLEWLQAALNCKVPWDHLIRGV